MEKTFIHHYTQYSTSQKHKSPKKMFFNTIEMLESLKNPQKQYDIMKLYRPASNEGFSSSSPENSGQRSVSYGHH